VYRVKNNNSEFKFENGEIDFSAYSYRISSWGTSTLNKDQTKRLYLRMKEYYIQDDDIESELEDLKNKYISLGKEHEKLLNFVRSKGWKIVV
jgi:hypothetical protein